MHVSTHEPLHPVHVFAQVNPHVPWHGHHLGCTLAKFVIELNCIISPSLL